MMCDTTSERGVSQLDDVCRDFLRNVCNRGKKCRFKHPVQVPNVSNSCFSPEEEKINFCKTVCHDFQNTGCSREGCKYIHCSKEDQDNFMETGVLSTHVLEDAIAKAVIPCLPDAAPVCRDYLSGECRRGKSCRFRHLSHCIYRKELDVLFGVQPADTCPSSYPEAKRIKTAGSPCTGYGAELTCAAPSHGLHQNYFSHDRCNTCSSNMCVTERFSAPPHQSHHFHGSCHQLTPLAGGSCCERAQDSHLAQHPSSLQDENAILKKQIFELRRQVSDLMTANEFLLEQNATLRLLRKNGGMMTLQPSGQATLNVQPAPGQQLVASAVPVSIAQVTGPGPGQMTLSTMAMTGQGSTQQLVPVSCHAPGQQIMAAVNTVTVAGQTGSPALLATAVPVSVSNTASQLVPVSAVPVSLATVSMAPMHIPPIVTAASEPPHSIAMSVSAATSLVSYPMMTQPLLQTR